MKLKIKNIFTFLFVFICLSASLNPVNVFAEDTEYNNQLGLGLSFGTTTSESTDASAGTMEIKIGKLTKSDEAATNILTKYRSTILIFGGIGILSMLLFFILNFIKLGKSAGNPQMRQGALMGLLATGIATIVLSGAMTFYTFFYNLL